MDMHAFDTYWCYTIAVCMFKFRGGDWGGVSRENFGHLSRDLPSLGCQVWQ